MKNFRGFIASSIGSLVLLVANAHGQVTGANVPEQNATAVLYVDKHNAQAADSNPGTTALPLKTLSKAVELAGINSGHQRGTKVLIAPGYYRESLAIWQQSDAPIVFEARRKGEVVVVGSDIWTGWQRQGSTTVYTHVWPYDWGMTAVPPDWQLEGEAKTAFAPIVRRREMIFVNGTHLKQVMSSAALTANSFYVDEAQDVVSLRPAAGTNMATALVEVAVRPSLFAAFGNKNIVLRGIVFKHANSPLNAEAVRFEGATNILIEDCRFGSNNWGGLSLGSSRNVTVRRSSANYNGGIGMAAAFGKNFLFTDTETSSNNWRGIMGGYTGWSIAGLKHLFIHDALYLRHKAVQNQTLGFWIDSDSSNVTVDGAFLHDNLTFGMFIEANQGPITVKGSIACHNRAPGFLINNSRDVTLENNVLYGNARAQLLVEGTPPDGRPMRNWETGEQFTLVSERWHIRDNDLVAKNANQLLLETNLGGSTSAAWTKFQRSLIAGKNLWYQPSGAPSFRVFGWSTETKNVDLNEWRTLTNQDLDSVMTAPGFIDPDNHQF